jgi:hypothetical protein
MGLKKTFAADRDNDSVYFANEKQNNYLRKKIKIYLESINKEKNRDYKNKPE